MKYIIFLFFIIASQAKAECFPVTEVLKVVDGDTVDVQIRVKPLDLDLLSNMRTVSYTHLTLPTKRIV